MKFYNLLIILVSLLLIFGCGEEQQIETNTDTTTVQTDEEQIKAALTELIERVKEGDKTVLYENEFTYYTDSVSLSEYMEIHKVLDYKYDTLYGIAFDSIIVMDDSAVIAARIIYKSPGSGQTERRYPLKAYRSGEKWVRPYLSNYAREAEYLERVRAYQEAIKNE
jgi:hypothetical protein